MYGVARFKVAACLNAPGKYLPFSIRWRRLQAALPGEIVDTVLQCLLRVGAPQLPNPVQW
jgi:hypothetical protein